MTKQKLITSCMMLFLLLITSLPALSSGYIWLDRGDGTGQWVYIPDNTPEQRSLNEDWADQHLNDPDTGFNDLEFE